MNKKDEPSKQVKRNVIRSNGLLIRTFLTLCFLFNMFELASCFTKPNLLSPTCYTVSQRAITMYSGKRSTKRNYLCLSSTYTTAGNPLQSLQIELRNTLDDAQKSILSFLRNNWLALGEVLVIYLAKKWPTFGCTGGPLKPEFFINKLGVFIIFFINGLALSLKSDPSEIGAVTKTNAMIQLYNLVFIPIFAKIFAPMYPNKAFVDGFLVLSVIPTTINICVAQTSAAGGNMGTVIFNAIFGNMLGVVFTPMLAVAILGAGQAVSLFDTFYKLGGLVVLPMVLGQFFRRTPLVNLAEKNRDASRLFGSMLLLAIVYTTFCDTFIAGLGVGGKDLATLLITVPVVYVGLSMCFWYLSKKLQPGLDARTRTAAFLASSQKTLAFGIPFIKTALGSRSDLANVLAPLLLYAPAQLLIGSAFFVPWLRETIRIEQEFAEGGGI